MMLLHMQPPACPPIPCSPVPPVLRPCSRAFAWWALVMLVLDLSYTAVLCPVSVAFATRNSGLPFILDFLAGLLFTVDVGFNFSTGYVVQVCWSAGWVPGPARVACAPLPPLPHHLQHGMRQFVALARGVVARLYVCRGTFLVDAFSSLVVR